MTWRTVTVPVPYRAGDGGTVHKRPQGTVRGRLGTVDTDRAMASFRNHPGGFHGVAAEARRRGVGGVQGQDGTFEATQLLPRVSCVVPIGQRPEKGEWRRLLASRQRPPPWSIKD